MGLHSWLTGTNTLLMNRSWKLRTSRRARWNSPIEALEVRALLSAVGTLTPTASQDVAISAGAEAEWNAGRHFVPRIATVLQASGPSVGDVDPGAPAVITGIEGVNFDENATNAGFYSIPPDPHGAVGPEHVVSITNYSIEWHSKTGTQQNSQRLGKNSTTAVGGFFAPLNPVNTLFDPKVVYDQMSNRFVAVALERRDTARGDAVNTSRILLAVSDDSNPNGTWHFLAIEGKINIGGTDSWADYPGLSVDEEAIYITNNQFAFGTNAFLGNRLWIVNKAQIYANEASPAVTVHDTSTLAGLPGQSGTTQPAHMFGAGPGSTGTFLVSTGWASTNEFVSVIRVDNPLTSPTFTNQFVSVGNLQTDFVTFPNSPQPGSSIKIWTNDNRALNAVWRNNNLYLVNTIFPASGPHAGEETAHWYKISTSNLASLTVADQGDIGGEDIAANTRTFFPSIAVDSNDNIAIGFSAAGPNLYGSAYFTIHRAGAAAGTTETPTVMAAGQDYYVRTFTSGSTGRNRWGDYTATVVDPLDDSFWTFNQYAMTRGTTFTGEDGRWATRWGKFTASLNSQPVLTPSGTSTLDSISVNVPNANNPGTLISDIISRMSPGGGITDPDVGALQGIAINGATGTSTGSWEYSTNGGSNWTAVGTVSNDTARLLASNANTRLRYVPNAGFKGTAKVYFVAWDQSTGTNGGTGVTKFRTGASPYSLAYDFAQVTVTNSAPVLVDAGAPVLDAVPMNQPAASNSGTLVSAIISSMSPLGSISDSDAGALLGIAINGLTGTATGTWEFSTDDGSNWAAIATTGNSNARLLAADSQTRIRYRPNTSFLGIAKIAFVAWDRTSGTNGSTANVSSRGGTTAYSSIYEYASVTVFNSAPVLTVTGSAFLDDIPMNVSNAANVGTLISTLISRSGGISDPNSGALTGIAINGLTGTANGTWEYSINGGSSWATIGTTGNSNARLLAADANTRVRFVPNLGFTGTVKLAFVAWDQTSGVNGGIASVGTRGGSTAYSALYDYASLSVSAPV